MFKNILLFFIGVFVFSSCRTLNPSVMFQTYEGKNGSGYDTTVQHEKAFVFAPGDRFEMKVFTNDGFSLVDVTQTNLNNATTSLSYLIDKDSLVKLPLLGRVQLTGLTLDSAEKKLEGMYATYFIQPYVVMKMTNRVVYVFLGEGGQGRVVQLQDDHTSLIEAIATAGGISETGKAYKIKIIRGNLRNPEVYFVDLSTMEGVKNSNLYVQSNDIVYIEPATNVAAKLTAQITPFVALLTSILLVVSLANQ
jgi:polysaccharide export outer membrane protein